MAPTSPIEPDRQRRDAAAEYLLNRVNYERMPRIPYSTRHFKLDRMRELLHRLGAPQQGMPVVHVTGTKGKGSTATMIAAILTDAGYRTGLFTSPHFERIEERFSIDGRLCSGEELAALVETVKPAVEAMDQRAVDPANPDENRPTYFEIITAMAFEHFSRQSVDVAVLEVGLGGRLDSTNVAQSIVSVITSISLDHTAQLGNDLESIAAEKAGIVRPGVPVVSGVTQPEPREVIRQTARRLGATLVEAGVDFETVDSIAAEDAEDNETAADSFDYRRGGTTQLHNLHLAMPGRHQRANAAVALAAIDELRKIGWNVPETAVRSGLARAHCPGRAEVLDTRPIVVFDVAHNRASVEALVEVLNERFSGRKKWAIFAAGQDKDLRGMIDVLTAAFDEIVFTRYLDNPRAAPAQSLADLAHELTGQTHTMCPTPAESWAWAAEHAKPDDLVCITGSFFLVSEIRRQISFD